MTLNSRAQVLALAVLVMLAGQGAEAQRSRTHSRGSITTQEAQTRAAGTITQSQTLNNGTGPSTQEGSVPTSGANRRASTGFGARTAAPSVTTQTQVQRQAPVAPAARTQRARVGTQARAAVAAPGASAEVTGVIAQLKTAGLDSKLGNLEAQLSDVLSKNADLLSVAKEIIATNAAKPQLASLNQARIEGLMNIAKLSSAVRDTEAELGLPQQKLEQAFVALVQNAGRQAANWGEADQKNMVLLLDSANNHIRSGKSVSEAIELARQDVKSIAKVDIKLEDIKRLCKKV